jgi:hypothetical protein
LYLYLYASNKRGLLEMALKFKALKMLLLIVASLLGGLSVGRGAVIMQDSGVSPIISASAGNDSGSFSYMNTTDFLAVIITAGTDQNVGTGMQNPIATPPTVTYGAQTLTYVREDQRLNRGWLSVYYLANPLQNQSLTLSVDFGADVFPTGSGGFQIGALSLAGVDLLDPIAGHNGVQANNAGSGTNVISSLAPGLIDEGDLLLAGMVADNAVTHPFLAIQPNLNGTLLFNNVLAQRRGEVMYQELGADDIVGSSNDEVQVAWNGNNNFRVHVGTGVVFNQYVPPIIPEPTSMGLIAIAAVVLTARRKTQKVRLKDNGIALPMRRKERQG